MSERSQKLLQVLRAKIDSGVIDHKIDVDVGDTLLGIVRELNYDLSAQKPANAADEMANIAKELRELNRKTADAVKELHVLNRQISRAR